MKTIKKVGYALVLGFAVFVGYVFIAGPMAVTSYQPNDQMVNQLVRGNIEPGDHISIVPESMAKGTIMGDVVHVKDTRFTFRFEEGTPITYGEELTSDFVYAQEVMGIWVVTLKGGQ